MPKRYSRGAFLRRIVRDLRTDDIDVEARFIELRESKVTSRLFVETRVGKSDETWIMHHTVSSDFTKEDLDRVKSCLNHPRPGATPANIERVRQEYAYILEPDCDIIVVWNWAGRVNINLPVVLQDMARNAHPCTIPIPADGYGAIPIEIENIIKADRKRRDKKGRMKSITVSKIADDVIRRKSNSTSFYDKLFEQIRKSLEESSSPIQKDRQAFSIEGMTVDMTNNHIKLVYAAFGKGYVGGSRVIIHQALPKQILAQLGGRQLGDVITGLPLNPDHIIKSAKSLKKPVNSLSIKLVDKRIPLSVS